MRTETSQLRPSLISSPRLLPNRFFTINSYSIHIQFIFNLSSIHLQFIFNLSSIHLQFIFNSSIHLQFIFNSSSIHLQFIFNSSSIFMRAKISGDFQENPANQSLIGSKFHKNIKNIEISKYLKISGDFQENPANQSLIGSELHGGGWPRLMEEDNQTWSDVICNLVILVKYVLRNLVI